jgi:hypothetical protein
MIDAYARAGRTLDDPAYLHAARRAAAFILDNMRDENGHLLRIMRNDIAEQPAFLEDYAFFIQGLLSLHQAAGEPFWLDRAAELARLADQLFWDSGTNDAEPPGSSGGDAGTREQGGGYFFALESPHLIARSKSIDDGAIPSGNSAMLHNLLTLSELTSDTHWQRRADAMFAAFGRSLLDHPGAHIHMIHAVERMLRADSTRIASGSQAPSRVNPAARPDDIAITIQPKSDQLRPGQTFRIFVQLDISPPWHINANPASAPNLIPTLVDLRCDAPVELLSVDYPKPQQIKTDFADEPLKVFQGRTTITLTVRVADDAPAPATHTLNVFVQFQPCDHARCLPPAEQTIDLRIDIKD